MDKINLKYVAVAFEMTDAFSILRQLCFECGTENVKDALNEIAAQQSVQSDVATCECKKPALYTSKTGWKCSLCGKPPRR